MLGVNQSDFMSYMSALKSNYRKGVHRMEAILSNPTHAKEFAANLGGVGVVLGVPVNLPDRNSDKLLELLLGSDVADDAVETWLHQFYEFTGWDDLLSDSARCKEMANNPLIWRAAGGSKLAVGKSIATLAGLSCADYADIDAVAASQVAMAAIVKSPVAMAAMWRSDTAIKALQANATAWKTFTGASSAVMGKTVAILANLDPSGYADMTAVASSQVAMTAVASSQVAMAAVIGNATALNAVVTSSVAMAAIIGNSTALNAVVTSQVAMAAVAASATALKAVVASSTACGAIESSTVAINAMNAASGFTEQTNMTCQANSSMNAITINTKAWVNEYWNSSSDTNTSVRMLIGVAVVGGGSVNIGNLSTAKTRQKVNKFMSTIRLATTYGSSLTYGGIRYKPIS